MKKDTLYKVNKGNKGVFNRDTNLFGGESLMDNATHSNLLIPHIPNNFWEWAKDQNLTNNVVDYGMDLLKPVGGLNIPGGRMEGLGISDSLSNVKMPDMTANLKGLDIKPVKKKSNIGNIVKEGLGAVSGTAGAVLGNAIGGGYEAKGSDIVTGISSIGQAINTGNPAIDISKNFILGALPGLYKIGWGYKENKKNTAAIKENTQIAEDAGNALANASDSNMFMNAAGNMTASSGFNANDLYKNGWFTHKGTKKGNKLINAENNALALQNHGMLMGANKVDSIMDDNVMSNFAAYGGPLEMINNNDMGAIEYGFMSDYLTNYRDKNKLNTKSDNMLGNNTLFAIGGDMQAHGSDWSDGLVTIGAGGSHESNPNEGVQVGVDPEGNPNLVEEGEVIYNDYVYSNRIKLDEEAKKKFHFSKKLDITYSEAAKKLEKEISERPNDPISKAAFKVQMEDLANEQERQKQEMEAERAEQAFNALSDEEKVAVMQQMQQAEQQEQMAQEQATQEQAMAEQQMSPEEQMMMEQQAAQQQAQMSPEEAAMMGQQMAYGGKVNRFDLGGEIRKYLANRPITSVQKEAIANAMISYFKNKRWPTRKVLNKNGKLVESKIYNGNREFDNLYYDIIRGHNNRFTPKQYANLTNKKVSKRNYEHFNYLTKVLKIDKNVAFDLAFPKFNKSEFETVKGGGIFDEETGKYINYKNYQNYLEDIKAARSYTGTEKQDAITKWGKTESGLKTKTTEGKTYYYAGNKYYSSEAEALKHINSSSNNNSIVQEDTVRVPKGTTVYRNPKSGNVYRTKEEAKADKGVRVTNTVKTTPKDIIVEAEPDVVSKVTVAPDVKKVTSVPVAQRNNGDIIPYDWYRNGSDGVTEGPLGFTVNTNDGTISQYNDDYINFVNNIGLDNIRDWVSRYGVDDSSYQSFINKGNSLDNLTIDQWRKGATDGKYGFMHHVLSKMYNNPLYRDPAAGLNDDEIVEADSNDTGSGEVLHAVEGDDDYIYNPNDIARLGKETRRVQLPNGDTVIYHTPTGNMYKTNGISNADLTDPFSVDSKHKIAPVIRKEWPRYVGLFGPAVGLGMMAAGVGKPDYTELDAAANLARGPVALADYKPIGNYLTYRPMDIWANQNRMNANARATDRAIMNTAGTRGAATAGLLASNYADQLGSGQLYRQALEYNDALGKQVAEYNRHTDEFNANAYNQTSQTNAQLLNRNKYYNAELAMRAADNKLNTNANWANQIYGNVQGLFKGISDIGRENAEHNQLARLIVSGALGNLPPENVMASGYAKYVDEAAKGGKLSRAKGKNKRRGLTF